MDPPSPPDYSLERSGEETGCSLDDATPKNKAPFGIFSKTQLQWSRVLCGRVEGAWALVWICVRAARCCSIVFGNGERVVLRALVRVEAA